MPAMLLLCHSEKHRGHGPLLQKICMRPCGWGYGREGLGAKVRDANFGSFIARRAMKVVAEPAGKPGSVVDSHSSRRNVTVTLKQPTRRHCGPQHSLPIWSCSRWGLPCRSVAGLAVRSYRTISPLPASRRTAGGIFLLHFPSARAAQALPGTVPCGARTFLGIVSNDATVWPTPPRALSHTGHAANPIAKRIRHRKDPATAPPATAATSPTSASSRPPQSTTRRASHALPWSRAGRRVRPVTVQPPPH